MGILDGERVEIRCSKCGATSEKTVRWLKSNKSYFCQCGATTVLDEGELLAEIRRVDAAYEKLQEDLKRFGRRDVFGR